MSKSLHPCSDTVEIEVLSNKEARRTAIAKDIRDVHWICRWASGSRPEEENGVAKPAKTALLFRWGNQYTSEKSC